jgi:sec-independent protein translocase protein TatA
MNSTILIFNLGGPELIIIMLVVLLLFGGRKIPELMKGLGKGIREFNSAKANIESEIKDGMKEIEKPKKEAILEKKSNEE